MAGASTDERLAISNNEEQSKNDEAGSDSRILRSSLFLLSTILFAATIAAASHHYNAKEINASNHNQYDSLGEDAKYLDMSKFDLEDVAIPQIHTNDNVNFNIRRQLRDHGDQEKPWTGSFANCTEDMKTSKKELEDVDLTLHPDSGVTTISCRKIHYRAPKAEIEMGGPKIVVGVLSAAARKGPLQRDSIRSTWARDTKNGVYFIVAGPWEDIKDEYEKFRDLIWLDEEEIYEGEESVLPFKTEAFLDILHRYTLPGSGRFEYLFKTDDDSYVNLEALEKTILNKNFDYWGCCTTTHFKPLRSKERKWMVTYELYPERFYPLYCQGAGFAMSRKFVECISNNVADFRYNPFEDVSVGLLAERCGVEPQSNFDAIKQYRTDEAGEKKQLNNVKQEEIYFLPRATMRKPKVLQHRVKTHYDMYAHYKCVQEGC